MSILKVYDVFFFIVIKYRMVKGYYGFAWIIFLTCAF